MEAIKCFRKPKMRINHFTNMSEKKEEIEVKGKKFKCTIFTSIN